MASVLKEKYIYEKYSARLLAVCRRYVGDKDAAEDVLHDSFITIFKKLDTLDFRGEEKLYGWMRRIAVNRSIDWLRKQKRSPQPLDDDADIPDEGGGEPEGVRKIPPGVLFRMIEELPEGYRTVFNLFCLDGYTHEEIAGMLGIKEKSSSSQYFRARAMLAQKIKKYLADGED